MPPYITVSTTALSRTEVSLLKSMLPSKFIFEETLSTTTSYLIAFRCVFTEKYIQALKWNIPIVHIEYFYRNFSSKSNEIDKINDSRFSNTFDCNGIFKDVSKIGFDIEPYMFNKMPFLGASFCTSDISNSVFRNYFSLLGAFFVEDLDRSVDFLVYSFSELCDDDDSKDKINDELKEKIRIKKFDLIDPLVKYYSKDKINLDINLKENNEEKNDLKDTTRIKNSKNNLNKYHLENNLNIHNLKDNFYEIDEIKRNKLKDDSITFKRKTKNDKNYEMNKFNLNENVVELNEKINIPEFDENYELNKLKLKDNGIETNEKYKISDYDENDHKLRITNEQINKNILKDVNKGSNNCDLNKHVDITESNYKMNSKMINMHTPEKVIFAFNNGIPIIDTKSVFENNFFLFKKDYHFHAFKEFIYNDSPKNIHKFSEKDSFQNNSIDEKKRIFDNKEKTFKENSLENINKLSEKDSFQKSSIDEKRRIFDNNKKTLTENSSENLHKLYDKDLFQSNSIDDNRKIYENNLKTLKENDKNQNTLDIFNDFIFYIDPNLHDKIFNKLKRLIISHGGIRVSSTNSATHILTNIFYYQKNDIENKKTDVKSFKEQSNINTSLFKDTKHRLKLSSSQSNINDRYICNSKFSNIVSDRNKENPDLFNINSETADNISCRSKENILHYQYIFDCIECKALLLTNFYIIRKPFKTPIFNRNHVFCIDKELKSLKNIIINKIKAMGGSIKNTPASGITHLIVKSKHVPHNNNSKIFTTLSKSDNKRKSLGITNLPFKIVEYGWIDQCLFGNKLIKEDKYLSKKPTLGHLLYKNKINQEKKITNLVDNRKFVSYNPDDEIIFQFTGLASAIKNKAIEIFQKYGIKYFDTEKYNNATHVIMGTVNTSEKFMCSLARGAWILVPDIINKYNGNNNFYFEKYEWRNNYSEDFDSESNSDNVDKNQNLNIKRYQNSDKILSQNNKENNFLDEKENKVNVENKKDFNINNYEKKEINCIGTNKIIADLNDDQKKIVDAISFWRKWVASKKRFAFTTWVVKLYCEEPKRENLVRVLNAGGAKILNNDFLNNGDITHVFVSRKFIGNIKEEKFYSVNYIFSYLFSLCRK